MRSLLLFVVVVILCAMCAQGALAQQGECKAISTAPAGWFWQGFITPVKFGGGWTATVAGANTGAEVPSTIQFTWYLRSAEGGTTPVTLTGTPPMLTGMLGAWLTPSKSVTTELIAPAGCDEKNQGCKTTPAPATAPPQMGCIEIGFLAQSLEALKGLPAPVVEMEYDGTVITVTRRPPHSSRAVGGVSRRAIEPNDGKTR